MTIAFTYSSNCKSNQTKSFDMITYYLSIQGEAIQLQIENNRNMLIYNYHYYDGEYGYRSLLDEHLLYEITNCMDTLIFSLQKNQSLGEDVLDGGYEEIIIDLKHRTLKLSFLDIGNIPAKYKELNSILEQIVSKEPKEKDSLVISEFKYNLIQNHKNYYDSSKYKNLEQIEEADEYFFVVEEMPTPIGGQFSIQEKIYYPESKINSGIQGRVIAYAYIDRQGRVINVEIIKSLGNEFDEIAKQAIYETKFTVGKQNGKPVKVKSLIKVKFTEQ